MEEVKKPVICPWCGGEMELQHCRTIHDNGAWYECKKCQSRSPFVFFASYDENAEMAYRQATYRPLGKPMTWEEVKDWPHDWIFIEFKISGSVYAMEPSVNKFQTQTLNVRIFGELGYETYGPYGDGFRCWDHYPTEEERRAAPWKT